MRNHLPFINVYKKRSIKSEVVTQLLYGDTFKKLKKNRSWIKVKNDQDLYKGFITNRNFPPNHKNTHKVFVLSSNLYWVRISLFTSKFIFKACTFIFNI